MVAYLLKSKHSQEGLSGFSFFCELLEVSTKSEATFQAGLDKSVQADTNRSV